MHKPRLPQKPDPLKHFSRDGPGVRLFAFFLQQLPLILASMGALCAAIIFGVGKFKSWW